jgi:hypothetical protein
MMQLKIIYFILRGCCIVWEGSLWSLHVSYNLLIFFLSAALINLLLAPKKAGYAAPIGAYSVFIDGEALHLWSNRINILG